jgi:hypothetical protein
MEDHFQQVLAPSLSSSSGPPRFIPSKSFTGSRQGYIFKKGDHGLGYYIDKYQSAPPNGVSSLDHADVGSRKRKLEDDDSGAVGVAFIES